MLVGFGRMAGRGGIGEGDLRRGAAGGRSRSIPSSVSSSEGVAEEEPSRVDACSPSARSRAETVEFFRLSAELEPTPGRMVIFPAWLYHAVDTNMSKEQGRAADRIILSFNVNQVRK